MPRVRPLTPLSEALTSLAHVTCAYLDCLAQPEVYGVIHDGEEYERF